MLALMMRLASWNVPFWGDMQKYPLYMGGIVAVAAAPIPSLCSPTTQMGHAAATIPFSTYPTSQTGNAAATLSLSPVARKL